MKYAESLNDFALAFEPEALILHDLHPLVEDFLKEQGELP